ncbi:MAG: hypothetical protein ACYDEZ_03345 [Methanoregula sp.]
MGVINGIILIGPCGNLPKRAGIQYLASPEGRKPQIAVPLAPIDAPCAYP